MEWLINEILGYTAFFSWVFCTIECCWCNRDHFWSWFFTGAFLFFLTCMFSDASLKLKEKKNV